MTNILLIDDSMLARNLLRHILEDKGYTICGEAANGREGFEKYKQLKPDLVFCDLMMDEMDGIECLRAIMSIAPEAKVVMCTSINDKLHLKEAMKSGAKSYLKKPAVADEVIHITKTLIGEPLPNTNLSYKKLMEKRAAEKGIEGKPLLDFFDTFRQVNGFGLDDPRVDVQYLKENTARITIAVRALLSAKLSIEILDYLMDVFEGLVS